MEQTKNTEKDCVSRQEYNDLLTELEQTRKKLAFYEALVDEIPMPTFVKTADARFCILNKAYEKFFNVDRASLLGASVLDMDHLPTEDRKRYQEEDLKCIKQTSEIHYEYLFETPEKNAFTMYWSKGFVTPGSNEKGLVGVIVDITAQKHFEDRLANTVEKLKKTQKDVDISTERMKLMLNTMPLAAQIWSKDSVLLEASQETARLFGFESPQDFISNFYKIHPEYQPNGEKSDELSKKYLNEALEKGYLRKKWVQLNDKGEEIPLDITFVRSSLNGEVVLLVFLKDMREYYDNINKLREADEYVKVMLNASPLGALICDEDINIINCNLALAKTFGLNETEEYVKNFNNLFPEYQPSGLKSSLHMQRQIKDAIENGSVTGHWVGRNINGVEIPCEVNVVRTQLRNRNLFVVFIKDLSEVEENLRKVRIAEARTEAILNGVPLGINIITPDLEVLDCNDEAYRITGFDNKKDYIDNFKNLFPATSLDGQPTEIFAKEKFEEVTKADKSNFEVELVSLDGRPLPFEVTLVYAHTSEEHLYITYARDLREDKKMMQEIELAKDAAEQSAHAKSEFLANMSHEIRTPMNGILGLLHILSETELNDMQANYMEKALFSTNELLRIINDILDFSKIEAGKLEMENTPFTLHDVCAELESLFGHAVEAKGLRFYMDEGELATTYILGDSLRLKQVLLNLINNAIKFTAIGSVSLKIEGTVSSNDQLKCLFSIQDTGIGLTAEQVSGLFSAFSQADTSVTRKYGGTGLGLAISKSIVEMMNGEIWVESEFGKGSCFYFSAIFDLAGDATHILARSKVHDYRQRQVTEHLLLVEDNQINQIIAEELLKNVGYTLDIANNGQEALDLLDKNEYDLVLMDIQMPIMDGLTTAKNIRKNPKFARLPVIAMSAHAMTGDKEKSLASGMNDHITKPISPEILYNTLNYWLEKEID